MNQKRGVFHAESTDIPEQTLSEHLTFPRESILMQNHTGQRRWARHNDADSSPLGMGQPAPTCLPGTNGSRNIDRVTEKRIYSFLQHTCTRYTYPTDQMQGTEQQHGDSRAARCTRTDETRHGQSTAEMASSDEPRHGCQSPWRPCQEHESTNACPRSQVRGRPSTASKRRSLAIFPLPGTCGLTREESTSSTAKRSCFVQPREAARLLLNLASQSLPKDKRDKVMRHCEARLLVWMVVALIARQSRICPTWTRCNASRILFRGGLGRKEMPLIIGTVVLHDLRCRHGAWGPRRQPVGGRDRPGGGEQVWMGGTAAERTSSCRHYCKASDCPAASHDREPATASGKSRPSGCTPKMEGRRVPLADLERSQKCLMIAAPEATAPD